MHKLLILKAFEKAKKDIGSDIPNRLATHLSDNVDFGKRSLLNKYNEILKKPDSEIEIKQYLVQKLCVYLGHDNFEDFILNNEPEITKNKNLINTPLTPAGIVQKRTPWVTVLSRGVNYKILFPGIIIIIVLSAFVLYIRKPRAMIWKGDHYEQVSFDLEKYGLNDLKLYREDRILNFKKITPICETTVFFKEDGSANLWYGKNAQGKLEFFTDIGLHPETGKTLKAITNYMIDKYICKDLVSLTEF